MTRAVGGRFFQWLQESYKPELLLPGLIKGVLIGFMEISNEISLKPEMQRSPSRFSHVRAGARALPIHDPGKQWEKVYSK